MNEHPTYGRFPVLPIRNTVVFPGIIMPLRVGRTKSIAAIKAAQEKESWVLVVSQRDENEQGDPSPKELYPVGTLCHLERVKGDGSRGFQVMVRGVARMRLTDFKEGSHLEAHGESWADARDLDEKTSQALLKSLKDLALEILDLLPANTSQLSEVVKGIDDLGFLSYLCSGNLEITVGQKQELLESASLKTRVLTLLGIMQGHKEGLLIQSEIREKLSSKMGKMQREAILREQLNTIREELGESPVSGKDDYEKKIQDAGMPDEVKNTAMEEWKRLQSIGNSSPEAHVIRNYLDLLCAMPWSKSSTGEIDLEAAKKTLEADHYGLDKIKKRILQHLAVMKMKKGGRGSIILFVGPPGVGKTSLGQSIARALGRKFVRASLGGVRDDAEIRGHRRTYIGAMPGRIIQGIKRAGENNPVLMLDEIDKLSFSYQGDPAGALLEVLDPEQNANFMDHYLDVPFDLSKVFFIATANTLDTIPAPLLDRMEVIDLSGYTTAEKLHIAKNHLVPKQLEEHGLNAEQVQIPEETMNRLIGSYTREAGVRNLERVIAAVCRASAEKVIAKDAKLPVVVSLSDLDDILGGERYVHEVAERVSSPGLVTGLAWTPQGGDILFIESTLMPGKGKLTLTGQLGDVMKESAQIALSLVRSKLSAHIPSFDFDKRDVHIHVPAGAIPKDGPSAGVAIFTSLASLFTGRRVDTKIAMTGEVTLRGAVMPVGGIKEKVIAAHRAGIERIILSRRNEKDLKEVPEEVRSQLKFEFVENISQVLQLTLGLNWIGDETFGSTNRPSSPPPVAVA